MTASDTISGPRCLTAELPAPVLSTTLQSALIEVYPQQTVARVEGAVRDLAAVEITDQASYAKAQAHLLQAHDVLKLIETRCEFVKKPITQTGRAIDEIAAKLRDPLELLKRSVQGKIVAYARAEQAKADAIQAEARAKAEAERKRLQDIADQEAKDLAEVMGAPVAPAVVKVAAPAPVVQAAKPSAVSIRKVTRLVIDDESLIPYRIGERKLMMADRAEVKAVLGLGIPVPGCRLVEDEELAINPNASKE